MKKVFSVLVENTSGVLSHVSGLFSRRGYNIDSFSAGVTADPRFTRMTIVASGDELILEQIEKQLAKLCDVVDIKVLEPSSSVTRELMLIKIRATGEMKMKNGLFSFAEHLERYHAKTVDVDLPNDAVVVEIVGNHDKLDAYLMDIETMGCDILELARTGITGLSRGTDGVVNPDER
ncbi:MAG: acetolactate synthase small subunit [Lachnospiraceae bacterium]|nr:acetolactate synthase small subunit [Lachnospiraceae bacterium]